VEADVPVAAERDERRLAAILVADMVGYSRLMEADERGTIARQKAHRRELIDPKITEYHGRIVKTTGDGLLVEFASVVDATECAAVIQRGMAEREADGPEEHRIQYRMGVNLGDIVIEGDDILGDGVNVAARLEGLAEPGGICVSGTVHEHVAGKLDLAFDDMGEQTVKNIKKPVRVYGVRMAGAAGAGAEVEPPALELPDKPSIAVLPFENMSGDPEQEYFADGIAEDIITALSKFRWLFVIARNSSFTYKGRAVDVTQVARELGVRYVLEGSVRKGGDRLRISAQLIDATTGNHVWAERYDRQLDDIFELQDEITQTIVASLEPELATAERERAKRKPPGNLGAWEAYQRGFSQFYRFSNDGFVEAKKLLARAIELDPTFAPAYAGLAMVHVYEIQYAFAAEVTDQRARSLDQGLKLAAKAIALDNNDAGGHMALGRLHLLKGDPTTGIAELKRALDLNPNSATAYQALGAAEAYAGDVEAGIAYAQQALRLSPRDPLRWYAMNAIAGCYMRLQRWDEALDWARRTVREPHSVVWPYAHVVVCLVRLDRMEEARQAMKDLLEVAPAFSIRSLDQATAWVPDREFIDRYFKALRKAGLPE
jgi:adenylate cyclase